MLPPTVDEHQKITLMEKEIKRLRKIIKELKEGQNGVATARLI